MVNNVLGISKDVFWALQAEDSDANELNNNEITTLIKRDGFRFWGNRTTDTETYTFEVFTRTAQIPRTVSRRRNLPLLTARSLRPT